MYVYGVPIEKLEPIYVRKCLAILGYGGRNDDFKARSNITNKLMLAAVIRAKMHIGYLLKDLILMATQWP
jgi:hypothetical protein